MNPRPKFPLWTRSEVFGYKGVWAGFGVSSAGNARHSPMAHFCSGVGSVSRISSGPLGSLRIGHWWRLRGASSCSRLEKLCSGRLRCL